MKSVSKKICLFFIYLASILNVVPLIIEKDMDKELKFHIYQSLVLFVLNIVCGIGSLIALIFAIIALVKGDAPKLPLVGDKLQEAANK